MSRDLTIEQRTHDGAVIVTPIGHLDLHTYPQLRDTLLKCAAEAPTAVVVELGALTVERVSTLSLFPTVWMRTSVWPGVPLLLAGAGSDLQAMLATSAVPRFLPCHRELADALDSIDATPPRRRAEIDLPAEVASSHTARAWVTEQLRRFELTDCSSAVLIATELVENSVQHARTPLRLRLELHRAGLSVAVSDEDGSLPVLASRPAEPANPRFGMALVELFARAWGHSPRWNGGKTVWAVLPVPGGPNGPLDPPEAPSTA